MVYLSYFLAHSCLTRTFFITKTVQECPTRKETQRYADRLSSSQGSAVVSMQFLVQFSYFTYALLDRAKCATSSDLPTSDKELGTAASLKLSKGTMWKWDSPVKSCKVNVPVPLLLRLFFFSVLISSERFTFYVVDKINFILQMSCFVFHSWTRLFCVSNKKCWKQDYFCHI